MNTKTKKINHKSRSFWLKFAGYALTALTTSAGVAVYSLIPEINGGDDIVNALQEFQLFEQGMKLNMAVAIPIFASLIVFLLIIIRKNREFFKDKVSLGLIVIILFMYLAYSVVGIFMSACLGALPSVLASEFGFEPASRREKEKYLIEKELDIEGQKEIRREEVREEIKRRRR
jgi:magnesium-transporting ATPase (P-type)